MRNSTKMRSIFAALVGILASLLLQGAGATTVSKNLSVTITPATGAAAYLSAANLETTNLNSGVNTTIPSGGSATLTWDSTSASSCTGTGFSTGGSVGIGSVTVSPTTTTAYSVNCGGAVASARVTVSGVRIDAAATYCASNGGGDGSSGNPWQAACIQAAINAAATGDTVFLAAGNWALNVHNPGVVSSKQINLVGAGSGNTFDYLGHPNNGAGNPVGTFTTVYTTGGTSGTNSFPGGFIRFSACSPNGPNVSHIFFDGSQGYNGGFFDATFILYNGCSNAVISDVRHWACNPNFSEGQFIIDFLNENVTIQNSVFAAPPTLNIAQNYGGCQTLQTQEQNTQLIKNNIFYMVGANPFAMDNVTFVDNTTIYGCDQIGCSSALPGFGMAGCTTNGCDYPPFATTGSTGFYVRNNVFQNNVDVYPTGGGVNDPSTSGIINDLQYTGNWVVATIPEITSCEWHPYGSAPPNNDCATGTTGGAEGQQINGHGANFTIANNSLIGTSGAILDATGTGCTELGGIGASCGTTPASFENTVVNFFAHQNYMVGGTPAYTHDANTTNAQVSNNFGLDVSSGFTQNPTVSLPPGTVGNLGPGGIVSFLNDPPFTAQYGAVKWIASTSSITPTSGDSRWNYLPPITLSGISHGQTVYVWVMDSANHISAAASQVLP
jgi:hypothetical protein